MEGEEHGEETPDARGLIMAVVPEQFSETLVHAQGKAMHAAPDDEIPRSAVPQAAEQHREEQVEVHAQPPLSVAAERDVEIVAQPGGERDVPAPPEVGDAVALVRCAEVGGDFKAHPQGDADGHVRVTREVAVELQGVAVDAEQVFQSAVKRGVVEDARHEVHADIVRDDAFLKQADDDEPRARAEHLLRDAERLLQLRQEGAGAEDRAGEEGGEERHEEGEVRERPRGGHLPAVHINDITHGLEREERDAHKHGQRGRVGVRLACEVAPCADGKVGVFEHR